MKYKIVSSLTNDLSHQDLHADAMALNIRLHHKQSVSEEIEIRMQIIRVLLKLAETENSNYLRTVAEHQTVIHSLQNEKID
jgi:hypothetical protein